MKKLVALIFCATVAFGFNNVLKPRRGALIWEDNFDKGSRKDLTLIKRVAVSCNTPMYSSTEVSKLISHFFVFCFLFCFLN